MPSVRASKFSATSRCCFTPPKIFNRGIFLWFTRIHDKCPYCSLYFFLANLPSFFFLVVPQTGTTTISLYCPHLDFRVCILLSLFRSRVLNKEPCNDRSCGQFVWKDFHKLLGSYNSSSLCQRIRPRGEFFVDTDLYFGQLRRFSQLPIFVFLFPGYGGIPGTSIGRNFARDYGWSQGQLIGNISSRCCTRAFFPDV